MGGGNWRGTGTAWHLAEKGHDVTIVTPDPLIAKELMRTTSDIQIRANLAKLGARFMVESVIEHWHGDRADIRSLLDGSTSSIEASAIVTATTNMAWNEIKTKLGKTDIKFHVVGDNAAPRSAPYAFYDGRKVGIAI
jgi:glycerol-3-phosphate dehydrogenase